MDNTNFMKGHHHSKLLKNAKNAGFPNYMREAYRFPKHATDEQTIEADVKVDISEEEVAMNEMQKNLLESDSYIIRKEEPAFITKRHEVSHSHSHSEHSVFQSFREQETQSPREKSKIREWDSSMKQATRRPFQPSEVPSALKGISLKKIETVNYDYLKNQLKQTANNVLLFEEAIDRDSDLPEMVRKGEQLAPSESKVIAEEAEVVETPTAIKTEVSNSTPEVIMEEVEVAPKISAEILVSEEDEFIHDVTGSEELIEPDKTIEEALAEFKATKDQTASENVEQVAIVEKAVSQVKEPLNNQQMTDSDIKTITESEKVNVIEEMKHPSPTQALQTKAVETSTGKVLQQVITNKNVEELASKPLSGKQRHAMKRSLSWIMEQEEGKINLPYPYSYSRKELEESLKSSKKY